MHEPVLLVQQPFGHFFAHGFFFFFFFASVPWGPIASEVVSPLSAMTAVRLLRNVARNRAS